VKNKFIVLGMLTVAMTFGLTLSGCGTLITVTGTSRGSTARASGVSDGFVLVTGGSFMMGSPTTEAGRNSDEVQHGVTVSSFYMGKYEVTQAEYEEVMGTNPSYRKGPNGPVESLKWYDAVEYCNQRSLREGLTPAYRINREQRDPNNTSSFPGEVYWTVTWDRSANGYRLPTEAEWEYACRAGTTTAYYTGNTIGVDAAWYNANRNNLLHDVGQKLPNPWGLYDMYGNVSEWCWDWLENYSGSTQTDPVGPSSGNSRAFRGGGAASEPDTLRSAFRDSMAPAQYRADVGFRIVRPIS
jgi:formylglycine-generating enzyme required for sulfatase activity